MSEAAPRPARRRPRTLDFGIRLKRCRDKILSTRTNLCNFYGNCEAETMVEQTVIAAANRLDKGGEPFSFRGDSCTLARQRCGTDNGKAYARLMADGMFHEGLRKATDVDPPDDVTVDSDGNVAVVFPTRSLLGKLEHYLGIGAHQESGALGGAAAVCPSPSPRSD